MDDDAPGSPRWRADRLAELLDFAAGSRVRGGFGWLDDHGVPEPGRPLELWINARMTYVFAAAYAATGDSGHRALAEHGLEAIDATFRDRDEGGWFAFANASTAPTARDAADMTGDMTGDKDAYGHAFVTLATTTAAAAGIDGAGALAAEALAIQVDRFWEDGPGWVVDRWNRDWTVAADYRGANAAMHTVESWLAADALTGDAVWTRRAARMGSRIAAEAAEASWRIVEHFTADLRALPDFNQDRPADPFRPYGATPGHAFEWSRLLLELGHRSHDPLPSVPDAANALFDRAVADTRSDAPGLPYTTDWSGRPVVVERFHWVLCEAVQAAESLPPAARPDTEDLAERWWREIDRHFLDREGGGTSWWHELSPTGRVSRRTWRGKPDAYHAYNALTHRAAEQAQEVRNR